MYVHIVNNFLFLRFHFLIGLKKLYYYPPPFPQQTINMLCADNFQQKKYFIFYRCLYSVVSYPMLLQSFVNNM